MKRMELLAKLQQGEKIIVSCGLHSTAQIGSDTIRYDTFCKLLKQKTIVEVKLKNNRSLLEYYVINSDKQENIK